MTTHLKQQSVELESMIESTRKTLTVAEKTHDEWLIVSCLNELNRLQSDLALVDFSIKAAA